VNSKALTYATTVCNAAVGCHGGCGVKLNIPAPQPANRTTRQGRRGIAVALLFVVFSSAALSANSAQTPPAKKPNPEERSALEHEIRHQIAVLPFYSVFDFIDFTIKGPEVILIGQVLRPTLKSDAEAALKSLEGISVVVNQIELLPASPSDDELRNAVYRAIYENSELERYAVQTIPRIHIIVKGSVVMLEGRVDSPEDKKLAAAKAAGVANVQTVRNNLIVEARAGAGQ
jgi:hyperosmotically inducible periplasmic protein